MPGPPRRPDLAVLVHDFAGTGVVRNALRIAAAAHRAGLATEVWTVTADGPLTQELPPGIATRVLGSVRFGRLRRGVRIALAVPALALALRGDRPRIVLSAGNHFHLAAGAAVLVAGRPGDMRFLGRASNALQRGKFAGGLRVWLDALKYRSMDKVIAVSSEVAGDLTGLGGIPAGRIAVIPNGVDVPQVMARSAEPAGHDWFDRPEAPVIVGAGRLVRQKNFGLLIGAFAKLRAQRPARLALLGDGSRGVRAHITSLARRFGVLDDVLLAGFVANPYAYMAKAAVVAIPSLREGASNVLIEALACGTDVVASATTTGAAEVLDDGRFGTIVPEAGPEAFARALGNALDRPGSADEIRARARDYDLSVSLASYVRLFRRELDAEVVESPLAPERPE